MAEKKPKKLKKLIIQPRVKRTGPKPKKGKYDVILPKKTIKAPPAPSLVLSPNEKKSQRALERIAKDRDALEEASQLENFPEKFLGMDAYGWQKKVLEALNEKECQVALKAANGSGKTLSLIHI